MTREGEQNLAVGSEVPVDRPAVRRAAIATFIIFATNGFIFASWAARIPAVTQTLRLSTGEMGLVLLVGAIGSLCSMPLVGPISNRVGIVRTVRLGGLLAVLAGGLLALGLLIVSVLVVAIGLALFGIGIALWDVGQNIEGADVEHRLGRTIMPQFHAGFSGGAFLGAIVGAALSALGVPLPLHLAAIMVAVVIIMILVPRHFLPLTAHAATEASADDGALSATEGKEPRGARAAWTDTRTLLIGVVVLGATLTEGAGNDWIAKGSVDGLGTSQSGGAALFALFVGAMTLARWFGGRVIDKLGRVVALRLSMVSALIGLAVYSLAGSYWFAAVGALLWGLGAALAFPMGMSAASDDPRHAAARVSVVATIGYIAFLAGPPFLGFLGDHVGLRHALLAILVPIAVSLVLAGATRRRD
ncbi:MFS transporter [Sinomonas terrae]|uniref:MFS transporter n=1 Tax=Sinomonas terrae TaxID=2908838 RepID=A0ABS9TVL1_9MICC|nr:MFS transporter [Sinomonas terrae]MCH6468457.1 MFS transporter [Sinomonas terrae]